MGLVPLYKNRTASTGSPTTEEKIGFFDTRSLNVPRWTYLIPAFIGAFKYAKSEQQGEKTAFGAITIASTALYFINNKESDSTADLQDTDVPNGSINKNKVNSILSSLRTQLTTYYAFDASARCQAYKRLYEVNNAEFVTICNKYKNSYDRTLRDHMASTILTGCWDKDYYQFIINRMDNLNVV